MIITDIDYVEEVTESSNLSGGGSTESNRGISSILRSLLQSLTLYPASSASVLTLGGNSTGNTAISMNISMPILIAVNVSNTEHRNPRKHLKYLSSRTYRGWTF